MRQAFMLGAVVYLALAFCGCDQDQLNDAEALEEFGAAPLEPDIVPIPTATEVDLGRLLFFDPILSGDMDVACATCHPPDHGFADGIARSQGVGGQGLGPDRTGGAVIDRNAPTVLNSGFIGVLGPPGTPIESAPMFWDSRADGLEEQALGPIESDVEMRGSIPEDAIFDVVVGRLEVIDEYVDLFTAVFGDAAVTTDRIASAIAAYERSLVALDSPFDRFLAGDADAMTDRQRRGMRRFAEAGCGDCHSGPMFSDFDTHSLGIVSRHADGSLDVGAGDGEFRTPPLRNIALTAPYMHDGSLATLRDVLEHYDDISGGGGGDGPNGDNDDGPFEIARDARRLRLGGGDFDDIIAFLEALTSSGFDRTVPSRVPSGLQPGGDLRADFVPPTDVR